MKPEEVPYVRTNLSVGFDASSLPALYTATFGPTFAKSGKSFFRRRLWVTKEKHHPQGGDTISTVAKYRQARRRNADMGLASGSDQKSKSRRNFGGFSWLPNPVGVEAIKSKPTRLGIFGWFFLLEYGSAQWSVYIDKLVIRTKTALRVKDITDNIEGIGVAGCL